ncbi:hypothetical protein BGM24_25880 [Bacillus sp. FJAT-26377]|nr:hypothetical protein [Bacillus sp. FJAT-26377]
MANEKMEKGLKKFINEDLEGLLTKLFPLIDHDCPIQKRKLVEEALSFAYSQGYNKGADDVIEAHREMYRLTKNHFNS